MSSPPSDPEIGQTPEGTDYVHRLPPELLCEIFKELQHETTSSFLELPPRQQGPESAASSIWIPALTSICRTWRQAALSDRSLWQSLIIRSKTIGNSLAARQFLERSHPIPFRLSIHDDTYDARPGKIDFSAFFEFSSLENHAHRIESLHLAGWRDFTRKSEGSRLFLRSFPNLQNLHLDFRNLRPLLLVFPAFDPIYKNLSLKRLSICSGRAPEILPSTLTHLCLDQKLAGQTVYEFLQNLATVPRLRVLCLCWTSSPLDGEDHPELVRLPSLQYIRFRNIVFQRDVHPLILLYKLAIPAIENIIWNVSSTFDHGEGPSSPYSLPPTSYLESVTHLIARDQKSFEIQSLTNTIFSPLRVLPHFATKLLNVRHVTIADRDAEIASFRLTMESFLSLETFECSLTFMGSLGFKDLEAEDKPFLPNLTELILWVQADDLRISESIPFHDIRRLDGSLPQALLRSGFAQRDRHNARPYVIRLNVGDIDCWKDQGGRYAFGGQHE